MPTTSDNAPMWWVENTSDNSLSNAIQSAKKRNEVGAKKSTKPKSQPKDKESPVNDKVGRPEVDPSPPRGVVTPHRAHEQQH